MQTLGWVKTIEALRHLILGAWDDFDGANAKTTIPTFSKKSTIHAALSHARELCFSPMERHSCVCFAGLNDHDLYSSRRALIMTHRHTMMTFMTTHQPLFLIFRSARQPMMRDANGFFLTTLTYLHGEAFDEEA